jgi:predicted Zn-dependent protease
VLSNRALDRSDRLAQQARTDEARVEADLAHALNPWSVDVQLQRASLLQTLGRPEDARRALDDAIAIAPLDPEIWLALAGYQYYCWQDQGWRDTLSRARLLSGHDNVFADTDENVVASSDACTDLSG